MSEEHLTDGWEPDLPVGDTLARRFLFNLAAFHELPAAAAGGRVVRRDEFAAADLGRPAAMHNAATLLRPLPFDRPGEVLDAVEGFFDRGGRGEAYLWSAWPTPDLRPRGWVLEGGRLRLWVGYEDDRPVCVGSLFVEAGVAQFSLGVTLPEARRRGYWAAMAAVRLASEPGLPAVG